MAEVVDGVQWLDSNLRERAKAGTFGIAQLKVETYDGRPVKMHTESQVNLEPGTNLVNAAKRLAEELVKMAEEFTANPSGSLRVTIVLTTPEKGEKMPRVEGGCACKTATMTKTISQELAK